MTDLVDLCLWYLGLTDSRVDTLLDHLEADTGGSVRPAALNELIGSLGFANVKPLKLFR